ncbi:MAG: DNA primase [Thermodesulfobacteriota bacterium]
MESREEIKERIKEQSDIVQVISEHIDLKKAGSRYLGLCPFHGEKTPSFSVNPGHQFFHCFGCGESGDVFSFMMKYHSLDFPAALEELAKRCNIQLPQKAQSPAQEKRDQLRKEIFAINQRAMKIYRDCLESSPGAEAARKYLAQRGVSAAIREQFGIGYAPAKETAGWNFIGGQLGQQEFKAAVHAGLLVEKEQGGSYDRFRDRILFPILDTGGRVAGFGGRIVGDGQPKYMNSPESIVFDKSRLLLGLYQLRDEIRRSGRIVLVEGNFDLISLVDKGITNVAAPLGTALTARQVKLMKRFAGEALLLFDGDDAGVKAAMRAVPLFLAEQMDARVALLPRGEDPDTFVRNQGPDALQQVLEGSEELPQFVFDRLVGEHGVTLEGKSKIVENLKPLVKAASSDLQRSVIIAHFSKQLEIPEEQLRRGLQGGNEQPVVEAPVRVRPAPGSGAQLSAAQKKLVNCMLLHPQVCDQLEDAGARKQLEGTVGEVIFLQIKALQAKTGGCEPEDVLTCLSEGAEKNLVSELLLGASRSDSGGQEGESSVEEVAEIVSWLKRADLLEQSRFLIGEIERKQREGNFSELDELLRKKLEIDASLQGDTI